jgi:DNA-binding NarL/FixJ family response regulator
MSSVAQVTQPSSSAATSEGTRKVMIVDDHPTMRLGLRQLIDFEPDMRVTAEAASIADAMKLLSQSRPDLIVIDLSLEDGSGLELMKQVKAVHGDVPMLVLSMHDESLYAERALRAGARGYVMKRQGAEQLVDAIRTVLRGQVWISSTVSDRILGRMAGVAPQGAGSPVDTLSDRQMEIFDLIGRGLGSHEIAERLHLSVKTVDSHRENIKKKLGLRSPAELIRAAVISTSQESAPVEPPRATTKLTPESDAPVAAEFLG